jgi:hypothetical protein
VTRRFFVAALAALFPVARLKGEQVPNCAGEPVIVGNKVGCADSQSVPILPSEPTNLTIEWVPHWKIVIQPKVTEVKVDDSGFRYRVPSPRFFDVGLRSDGVVVWREQEVTR